MRGRQEAALLVTTSNIPASLLALLQVNGCVNPINQGPSALKAAPAAVATAPQAASLDQLKTVCGRAHGHH